LSNDLFQLGSSHFGFLELLEGASSLYALMLSRVSDEQYSVIRSKPSQKISNLIRAGKARFINKEEPMLLGRGILRTRKKALQSSRMNACLFQLLCRARSGSKSLDLVSLRFYSGANTFKHGRLAGTRDPLNSVDTVAGAEHVFNYSFLAGIQMWMRIGDRDGVLAGQYWLELVLPF
jgi:hypothetical protein